MKRRRFLGGLAGVGATLATGTVEATVGDGTNGAELTDVEPPSRGIDRPVKRYDRSIRTVTNSPHLLTLSEDAIDRHFEASTLEGREFEAARRYVRNLRKRYPVDRVESEGEVRFVLADDAQRTVETPRRRQRPLLPTGRDHREINQPAGGLPSIQSTRDLAAHELAVGVFGDRPADDPADATTLWTPTHHQQILQQALDDLGVSSDMDRYAGDPDSFNKMANGRLGLQDGDLTITDVPDHLGPADRVVDWAEDALGSVIKTAIDKTLKNYAQYYDPNLVTVGIPNVGNFGIQNIGMGPQAVESFYAAAVAANGRDKERYTAYASHYLQDMAMPLHTGNGLEQANISWNAGVRFGWPPAYADASANPQTWLHYGVENLAQYYWSETYETWSLWGLTFGIGPLEEDFGGDNSDVRVVTGKGIAKRMASYSTRYSDDIYQTVLENETADEKWKKPGQWSDDTVEEVLSVIDDCFVELGRCQRSLLISLGYGD